MNYEVAYQTTAGGRVVFCLPFCFKIILADLIEAACFSTPIVQIVVDNLFGHYVHLKKQHKVFFLIDRYRKKKRQQY